MKAFIISTNGDSAPIARKLLKEGIEVGLYVRNKASRRYIDPDIPLIKSPTIDEVVSDLLLIEDSESGRFADRAKELKRRIVGGGVLVDKLAIDRDLNERSLHGCGFVLAEENTEGTLIEVGGWFDGEKYLRPHFLGFKYYKLGTGDVGPVTMGMGIVGTYITKSRLFNDILRKTETFMKASHYRGYSSIEGFINNDSFRAIRLNPRLQFPTVNALGELHTTWGNFLVKLARQEAEVVAVQPGKVVIGVNVLMKGYFQNDGHERYKIFCASGQDVAEARSKAYKLVTKANICNGYYRIDIGDCFEANLDRLRKGEWL